MRGPGGHAAAFAAASGYLVGGDPCAYRRGGIRRLGGRIANDGGPVTRRNVRRGMVCAAEVITRVVWVLALVVVGRS